MDVRSCFVTGGRAAETSFREDVLAGLALPQKAIPARWFYDERGSQLFEEITRLPEYYLTRAEAEILAGRGAEIALAVGDGRAVVEFGAGSATKTDLLLRCVHPSAYVPIDISGDFLRSSCARLAQRFPNLPITPIEADFTLALQLPADIAGGALGFFPGSTIGNFAPATAIDLLRNLRRMMGENGLLLIGFDLIKDRGTLLSAYDDAAGVTAAFNLNLIERINRELGGNIPVDSFAHRVRWNEPLARIEMHLEAKRDLRFEVAGRVFAMHRGETIHTENSHKYDGRTVTTLLLGGRWYPLERFTDPEHRFTVVLAAGDDRLACQDAPSGT